MAEVLGDIMGKARAALTDTFDLILVIAGAGASLTIAEIIKSWFPEQTKDVKDETLAAAAGFAMFYFGNRIHPRLVPFGLGVLLASAGAWISEWVSGALSALKKK